MADGPLTVVAVSRVIDAPVERVWALVSDFGRLDRWTLEPITCTLEGEGVGAVRTVDAPRRHVRERLDALDDTARRLSYSFVDAVPLPVDDLVSTIEVRGADAQCEVHWSAVGTPQHDGAIAAVAGVMEPFLTNRLEELAAIAEGRAVAAAG